MRFNQQNSLQIMMTTSNGNIFRVTGPCAGNSPFSCEFPAQKPVTRSFDVFFDLRLIKRLSKHLPGWWFEMLSRPLWRHCNVIGNQTNFPVPCSQHSAFWWPCSAQCPGHLQIYGGPSFGLTCLKWGPVGLIVLHICISGLLVIGSGNGLLPIPRQALSWPIAVSLTIELLWTNWSEIWIKQTGFFQDFNSLRLSDAYMRL